MPLADDFKDALACWPCGAAIVATRSGGLLHALTVSSFASLSLDPPLVLFCVGSRSRILPMIADAGAFSVSVLDADQDAASRYFATAGREPAHQLPHVDGDALGDGRPAARGALAQLACALHAAYAEGDHTIVIGRVTSARTRGAGDPLVYVRRSYRRLTAPHLPRAIGAG